MQCPQCDNVIPEESNFCNECGAAIVKLNPEQIDSATLELKSDSTSLSPVKRPNFIKRHTKLLVIISAIIVVILVAGIISIPFVTTYLTYTQGITELNNGNPEEAMVLFQQIIDKNANYKDTSSLLEDCKLEIEYQNGLRLLDAKNYDQAYTAFKNLSEVREDYKNTQELRDYANAQQYYLNKGGEYDTLYFSKPMALLAYIPADYNGDYAEEIKNFKSFIEQEKINYENEQQIKQESLSKFENDISNCPLQITGSHMSSDSIGNPRVSVSCKNTTNKNIDAFTVDFYCYNNFNDPVQQYGYGESIFKGIAQEVVRPGQIYDGCNNFWQTYGFDTMTKFYAFVTEIHYEDGSTWKVSDAFSVQARKFANTQIPNITFS